MTLSERAAYLKGLKEGLKLNTETSEGKLLNEIIEMLEDVALSVNDLEDCTSAISDELDLIEEEIERTMSAAAVRTMTTMRMMRSSTRSSVPPATRLSTWTSICWRWAVSSAPTAAKNWSSTPSTTRKNKNNSRQKVLCRLSFVDSAPGYKPVSGGFAHFI